MTNPTPMSSQPLLSETTYARTKMIATILLPALQALYVALAGIWGIPYLEQVSGTLAAVNVFAGVVVLLAAKWYNAVGAGIDGDLEVEEDEDGKLTYSLSLTRDPGDFKTNKLITFQVVPK